MGKKKENKIYTFIKGTRKITIIGVRHDTPINTTTKNKLFKIFNDTINSCFLVEEDYKLSQNAIMTKPRFDEPTTRIIVNQLKKIGKKSIKGWDIRPSKLSTFQNGLYGENRDKKPHFGTHTLDQILKEYVHKLNDNLKQNYIGLYELQEQMPEKMWNSIDIYTLVNQNIIPIKFVNDIMVNLREDFKNISDEHTLKIIKENKKNYIIIAGNLHIHNLITYLKL